MTTPRPSRTDLIRYVTAMLAATDFLAEHRERPRLDVTA